MTDYTRGTGSGGIMLIRDQGWSVEFHIQAGQSATVVGSPGFGTNAYTDGAWRGLPNVSNYSNRVWRHLGSHNATYNQDVCFHIDYSGTQGFGGPTDFWQYIHRATVPGATTPLFIDTVTHQTFRYAFSGGSDGGSPIREWQIGYGYAGQGVQWTAASGGTSIVGTFTVGARIGIWSRGRNDVGWGPWSSEMQVQLLRGLKLKVAGTWRDVIPYTKLAGTWRASEPFVKYAGTWRASGQ